MEFEFPFPGETAALTPEIRSRIPGQFIELDQGVTHYELAGPQQAPLVVLVHGFSVPYFIWDPTFVSLVSVGLRVLRYDMFGRGYSDRPKARNDIGLFVEQLAQLLDALEVQQPVSLLGLSMGGLVSSGFAVRYPQRVTRLGLIDPAGFPLGYSWVFKLLNVPLLGEVLFTLQSSGNLENSMVSDIFDPKYIQEFIEQYRPQMQYRGFRRSLLSTLRSGILQDGPKWYRQVGMLDLPVLLVWGEEDGTVPLKYSRDLVEAIPQVEFHPISGAGHIPHYEKPGVVNPILIEFLRRK
jgi:pimeloyl-ACP methyl ester carboxylesterase